MSMMQSECIDRYGKKPKSSTIAYATSKTFQADLLATSIVFFIFVLNTTRHFSNATLKNNDWCFVCKHKVITHKLEGVKQLHN